MKMYWNLLLYKEVPAASQILKSEENYRNCKRKPWINQRLQDLVL